MQMTEIRGNPLPLYVFTLGGSCISWKSQLQPIVALSTKESEYIAITEAMKEALYMKGVMSELKFLKQPIVVFSTASQPYKCAKFLFFMIGLNTLMSDFILSGI